jgi:hypothetical protein
MNNFLSSIAFIAAVSTIPTAASAALPTGKLEYVIELRVRFTLDASSSDLVFTTNPLTGLAAADLPAQGYYRDPVTGQRSLRDFASITRAGFVVGIYYLQCVQYTRPICSGDDNYSLDFWTVNERVEPSILASKSFSLLAGTSTDYLFGMYTPRAEGAAPGLYESPGASLDLNYLGFDDSGNALRYSHRLGTTCPTLEPECSFTRTVVAAPVPEASTYAMMILGLLGVYLQLRRSRERSNA